MQSGLHFKPGESNVSAWTPSLKEIQNEKDNEVTKIKKCINYKTVYRCIETIQKIGASKKKLSELLK